MNQRFAVLLALVIAPAVLVPTVGAAPPKDKAKAELTIAANPTHVAFGGFTDLSGRLSGSGDVSGEQVRLQRDPWAFGQFKTFETRTTDPSGDWSFRAVPIVNTKYRATAKGGTTSPEVLVRVHAVVNLNVSNTNPRRGRRVRFSGTIAPPHDGKVARIQRRTSSGWKRIGRARLKDAGDIVSKYGKRVRIRRAARYRVLFPPRDGDHAVGRSRPVRISVR